MWVGADITPETSFDDLRQRELFKVYTYSEVDHLSDDDIPAQKIQLIQNLDRPDDYLGIIATSQCT